MNTIEISPEQLSMQVVFEVPVARIKNLLCSAEDGGSGYWCQAMDRMGGISREQAEYRHEVPFVKGGWLRVIEWEASLPQTTKACADRYFENIDGKICECYRLDGEAIRRGLQIFAEKYPVHFANFLKENEDADTGDAFLQCCVFGDAIYG